MACQIQFKSGRIEINACPAKIYHPLTRSVAMPRNDSEVIESTEILISREEILALPSSMRIIFDIVWSLFMQSRQLAEEAAEQRVRVLVEKLSNGEVRLLPATGDATAFLIEHPDILKGVAGSYDDIREGNFVPKEEIDTLLNR